MRRIFQLIRIRHNLTQVHNNKQHDGAFRWLCALSWQADGIQIVRYNKLQAYNSHHDYFPKVQHQPFYACFMPPCTCAHWPLPLTGVQRQGRDTQLWPAFRRCLPFSPPLLCCLSCSCTVRLQPLRDALSLPEQRRRGDTYTALTAELTVLRKPQGGQTVFPSADVSKGVKLPLNTVVL